MIAGVYSFCLGRFGFLLGHVVFILLYAYLAGVSFQIFLEGFDAIVLNPVVVWKQLLNHWNHWSAYKGQLELLLWFRLFAALIFPLIFIPLVSKIIKLFLSFVFWPFRAWKKRRLENMPKILTTEEKLEALENEVESLKAELEQLHSPELPPCEKPEAAEADNSSSIPAAKP
jgi:hypothetical protein